MGEHFRFEAEVAGGGLSAGAAGDFFAVDPEADFAVECRGCNSGSIRGTLAQFFAREAAAAVGANEVRRA